MTNPNDPTMSLAVAPNGDIAKIAVEFLGLTKRELFAAMAMQGLLASVDDDYNRIAHWAVGHADALIIELNKNREIA